MNILKKRWEAGETVIANIHIDSDLITSAKKANRYTCIGRGSIGGNRFIMGKDGDRNSVCNKYEIELKEKPDLIKRIPELKGHVLGCYCAPRRCHGNTLLKYTSYETN